MDVLDEMGSGELDDILDVLFGTYPFILDLLPRTRLSIAAIPGCVTVR
jgi:hypothetical protein